MVDYPSPGIFYSTLLLSSSAAPDFFLFAFISLLPKFFE
jgi:hypothetical protein